MITKDNVVTVIERAFDAAYAAYAAYAATCKHISDNPNVWYPCGFAMVNIKPARGPLVNYLKKKKNISRHDDYTGGWTVYNPSGHNTQWMDAKEKVLEPSLRFSSSMASRQPLLPASTEEFK